MVQLFISAYPEKDRSRAEELHTCLMNNLKSGCFDAIWVIAEDDGKDFEYMKSGHWNVDPYTVNVLPCTVRPTFRTFFEAANNIMARLGNDQNVVSIICNSDIYFEQIPVLPKFDECFALTRYEVKRNGPITFLNRKDSQDSFFFRGFIKIPKFCDAHLGIPGVDNRCCAELLNVGYKVLNPSLTIKSFHLHDGAKSYDGSVKVGRPYHFVDPIELNP